MTNSRGSDAVLQNTGNLSLLVSAASDGDCRSFDLIVRRFQDMAVGYAYAILGDFQRAEDAAQESFLEAYRGLAGLTDPEAFPGWFKTILWRQCRRITRRTEIPTTPFDSALDLSLPSAHEWFAREETRRQVWSAIEALPEKPREAAILFYINEHSLKEIALFLGISENAVKKRLQSARAVLKETMLTMVENTLRDKRPSRDNALADRIRFFLAIDSGDADTAGDILTLYPGLVHERRQRDGDTPPSGAWGRRWGVTALHLAAGQGDVALIHLLLDRVADIEAEDLSGEPPDRSTPLQWAARAGQLEAVKLLVERGANVNAGYDPEISGGVAAAVSYYDHREVAEYLLSQGARLTIFTAVALDRRGGIRELAAADPAIIHARLDAGRQEFTPLHLAARKDLGEMAALLLELGAERDALDAQERNPVDLALIAGNRSAYEALTAVGATPSPVWAERCGSIDRAARLNRLLWASGGDDDTVRAVLAEDPSLANAVQPNFWPDNYCGATALFFAAWTGQREVAEILIAHGADPNARDSRYGGTPAEWAEENHRAEMAAWLAALFS